MTPAAQWVHVKGWPGYELDLATGIVRSVDRVIVETTGKTRRIKGVTLVQVPDVRGHPQVTLSHGGRRKAFRVERLLSEAHKRHRKAHTHDE
ncbi:hypothetical protein AU190_22255 [Mycolicibacterium acapulense]|nr:hypothetical protein AU190_22255 [Mycolicibacterium acapulense]